MQKILVNLLTVLLFAVATGGCLGAGPESISYTIKPLVRGDRVVLEATVRFRSAGQITIGLPTDNFGTPDLHKYVIEFEGLDGTVVKQGDSSSHRTVLPAEDGSVAVRYVLSYDPAVMEGYAYGPNVGPDFFHLAGCQWLLHIGDDAEKRRMRIRFVDVPKGWKLYTSKAASAESIDAEAAYDDWATATFGGGANVHTFMLKGGNVSIFVHGRYDISRDKIYAAIEKIIRLQRAWFDDYSQPNFTVVVAPRPWVVAGYAPEDSFVCFIKPDVLPQQLNRLVAHELFHNWLPNKISIKQDKGFSDIRYEWFTEGFTDYFGRKILTESGLMTAQEFAASVNADLKSIADNPLKAATYDELSRLEKERKYGPAAKKLAYFRGALMALNWDHRIRRSGRGAGLSGFIRELYKLAAKSGGAITEVAFFNFADGYGTDARGELRRFITNGEPIVPESVALGDRYKLQLAELPAFDIGFSLDETYKTRKLTAVNDDGPAFRAGLREGMDFVAVENSARFSNAWTADKPLVVRVKLNGTEKSFSYFPAGEPVKVWQFR
jgi:predicted metalloprotease with PDZ domain